MKSESVKSWKDVEAGCAMKWPSDDYQRLDSTPTVCSEGKASDLGSEGSNFELIASAIYGGLVLQRTSRRFIKGGFIDYETSLDCRKGRAELSFCYRFSPLGDGQSVGTTYRYVGSTHVVEDEVRLLVRSGKRDVYTGGSRTTKALVAKPDFKIQVSLCDKRIDSVEIRDLDHKSQFPRILNTS